MTLKLCNAASDAIVATVANADPRRFVVSVPVNGHAVPVSMWLSGNQALACRNGAYDFDGTLRPSTVINNIQS